MTHETPPALVDVLVQDCIEREGNVRHMYRDGPGHVTVGVGNLLPTEASAMRLPFEIFRGTPATEAEIRFEWNRVRDLDAGHSPGYYIRGWSSYPHLPDGYAVELCRSRIVGDFIPGLRRLLPAVDTFPPSAVRALVAMAYALGIGRPAKGDQPATGLMGYPHLLAACNRGDWASAAGECRIRTARSETNARNVRWFLEAGRPVVT